jgi:hypothetical protein
MDNGGERNFAFNIDVGQETGIGNGNNVVSSVTYEYGEWYHVVGIRDEFGNGKIFVNGVLEGQTTGNTLDLGS